MRRKSDAPIATVRVALDPTSEQLSKLFSAAGGARFCYNAVLNVVQEKYRKKEKVTCEIVYPSFNMILTGSENFISQSIKFWDNKEIVTKQDFVNKLI